MNFENPVLRLMARDYLAILATTCIAERSFSLLARTDDPLMSLPVAMREPTKTMQVRWGL